VVITCYENKIEVPNIVLKQRAWVCIAIEMQNKMKVSLLWIFLALTLTLFTDAFEATSGKKTVSRCSSHFDCSLNGKCVSGRCYCNPGWKNSKCSELNLLPQKPDYIPAYGYEPNVTSWGGNIIYDEKTEEYHLFVSEIPGGLREWTKKSRIIHGVSNDPLGVFKKKDVVLPAWAHNAAPVLAPENYDGNKTLPWFVFHIGQGNLHAASNPNGPWIKLPEFGGCNNPAPMFHNNGSLYVACPGRILRAICAHMGIWEQVSEIKYPYIYGNGMPGITEDPFLFMDPNNNWHFITHRYNTSQGYPDRYGEILVSGHAFSENGIDWKFSSEQPYPNYRVYGDNTRKYFATVERPKLVFNKGGWPAYLVNGVSPIWDQFDPGRPCSICQPMVSFLYTVCRLITNMHIHLYRIEVINHLHTAALIVK